MIEYNRPGRFALAATALLASVAASASPVPQSAQDIRPLLVGSAVPSVTLRNSQGKDIDLVAEIRAQPTVLIFYRGGWCPYCNTHLGELQQLHPRLERLGYQILAISPDRPEKLTPCAAKNRLSYRLLSDSRMEAARAFGVAFRLDDQTVTKYRDHHGIDIEADSGQTHHQLPVPSAFVVGADGRIRFVHADPDYKARVDAELLYTAARAAVEQQRSAKPVGDVQR